MRVPFTGEKVGRPHIPALRFSTPSVPLRLLSSQLSAVDPITGLRKPRIFPAHKGQGRPKQMEKRRVTMAPFLARLRELGREGLFPQSA